jgi:hypothetical protein
MQSRFLKRKEKKLELVRSTSTAFLDLSRVKNSHFTPSTFSAGYFRHGNLVIFQCYHLPDCANKSFRFQREIIFTQTHPSQTGERGKTRTRRFLRLLAKTAE